MKAAWFFISKTIFHFLIGHTIFDVKECIFKIRCHQSAHSTLQWCKGQVYILQSHQLKFCLIRDIIWWRFCCICLNLQKFIWSSHLEAVRELHGPLVHWSSGSSWSGGHPSLSGQQFKSHAPQNISLSNEQSIPFYFKAHDILSFFSRRFKAEKKRIKRKGANTETDLHQ